MNRKQYHRSLLYTSSLLFFFMHSLQQAIGQNLLDDTIRTTYGAKTTSLFYEEDIKLLKDSVSAIDTTLVSFERFTEIDKKQNFWVDLGANGTAAHSIFFETPQKIGLRSGFDNYELYYKSTDIFPFYNTRSPYIKAYWANGSQGRQVVDIQYAINKTQGWNFGADFYRIATDKQIGAIRSEGDENSKVNIFDIHTSFLSKNNKYHLLFYILRFQNDVNETGGVNAPDTASALDLFQYRSAPIRLSGVKNYQRKIQYHAFQKYKLANSFQPYCVINRLIEVNHYRDYTVSNNNQNSLDVSGKNIYPQSIISQDTTDEINTFEEWNYEVGALGDIRFIKYYAFLKQRIMYFSPVNNPNAYYYETYIGGRLNTKILKKWNLEGRGELSLNGLYNISASMSLFFLNVYFKSVRYSPSLIAQNYKGNNFQWENNFSPSFAEEIGGKIHIQFLKTEIIPQIKITRLGQQIYYGRDLNPYQSNQSQLIISPIVDIKWNLKNIFFIENTTLYTLVTGKDVDIFPVPTWFINGKVYTEFLMFKKYMRLQAGVNIHYQSAYYGNSYNPVLQQFYIQNTFLLKEYWTMDIFANIKIQNFRIFVKYTHINQITDNGYFLVPGYPGQRGSFDFGASWYFFD